MFRPIKLNMGLSGFRYIETWLNQSFANLEGFTSLIGLSMLDHRRHRRRQRDRVLIPAEGRHGRDY